MSKQIVQGEETGICVKGYTTFSSSYAIQEKICPHAGKFDDLIHFDDLINDGKHYSER